MGTQTGDRLSGALQWSPGAMMLFKKQFYLRARDDGYGETPLLPHYFCTSGALVRPRKKERPQTGKLTPVTREWDGYLVTGYRN
ncbi:hypothetical protein [Phormidium sp. CCY1219]|uniref:hypothetical protein n=1 Tax=Phormidium sp. CCY1219 TaxID=2886104 RepID=UPI002D1F3D5C|nr:hypothetical protein [Phormidium sp. CCY1219]MEB3830865.1 hypothetical protein [Phormidium sp. CCY1219]